MPNPAPESQPLVPGSQPLMVLIGGQVVAALAGLICGKLASIYIEPDVWGDYSLLLTGMALVHGFFITPMLQSFKAALGRFLQQRAIAFYGTLLAGIYLILGALALLAGLYYQNSMFSLIWIVAVGQGFYQFGSTYLNASGQHRNYALLQAAYAVSALIAFAFIIIGLKQRSISGLWQSSALINVVFATIAVVRFIPLNRLAFFLSIRSNSAELFQAYKQYVWPLLSLIFWSWLINYADRYLIRLYMTETDVGQYSMGYSLGSKLLVVVAPLLAFLSPRVLRLQAAGQSPEMADAVLRPYLIRYVLLAGVGCVLFYVGRDWIGSLLLSDQYRPAFPVGPIVAIGYLFLTSIHILELKWYTFGQTQFILWHNVSGAFLNIGFNLLLIPRLGIIGAALATVLGFASQFLLAIGLFTGIRPANR